MSPPTPSKAPGIATSIADTPIPTRPEPTAIQTPQGNVSNSTLRPEVPGVQSTPAKKKKKRGGKKRRPRRQSFAASGEDGSGMPDINQTNLDEAPRGAARESFYRVQGGNLSNTSIESEALLDHR